MGPQGDEPLVDDPLAAHHHPQDRRLEVVVADQPARHPTEVSERERVALQERLLRLMDERHREPTPRGRQAHDEQLQHQQLPVDAGAELAEVDLGVLTQRVLLTKRHVQRGVASSAFTSAT